MLTDVRAVVFDWDGVIVDTMPLIAEGIREVAKSYRVDVSVESILATYFQPKEAFYKSIGIEPEDMEELRRRHANMDAMTRLRSVGDIFADVRPTLEKLEKRGTYLAIATQRENPYISEEITRLDLSNFFSLKYITGGQDKKEDKLKELAARFYVPIGDILFVGDLPSDIVAAKSAGTRSAGINRQEVGRERLARENPDVLLTSLTELPDMLL